MTKITKVKTGSRLEEISSYSRIVAVDNWIFVSNTAGRNPQTKNIPKEVLAQTHQVFANIAGALALGHRLDDAGNPLRAWQPVSRRHSATGVPRPGSVQPIRQPGDF